MSDHLRKQLIRLAYRQPELRKDLLPLLRQAAEQGSFADYIDRNDFRHPETGNQVQYNSLPKKEKEKIHAKWKKSKQGISGQGTGFVEQDSYLAKHVFGEITQKSMTDALKDTDWAPVGKGSLNKNTQMVEMTLKSKKGKPPLHVSFDIHPDHRGDYSGTITFNRSKNDQYSFNTSHDDNPKKDAEDLQKLLKKLLIEEMS